MHYVDLRTRRPRTIKPQWQTVDLTPPAPPTAAGVAGDLERRADLAAACLDGAAHHLAGQDPEPDMPWNPAVTAPAAPTRVEQRWSGNAEQVDTALDRPVLSGSPGLAGVHWPSLLMAGGALAFALFLARR